MKMLVHDYAGHAFAVHLSRALAARGHEVLHLYASVLQCPRGELERRPDDPQTYQNREVPMHPDYVRFKYSFRKRRNLEVAYGRAAAEMIRDFKPEVVLSGQTPTEAQGHLIRAAKKCGSRFVFWCQDFYSIAVDKLVRKRIPVLGPLIGGYYRYLDRRQFHASDHIVVITDDFIPIMEKEFGVSADQISTVPNWAPLETIPVLPKDNEWSRRHGLHEKFVYLYSGTLGMKHNPDLLLQLALLTRNDPNVRVLVITEGIGAQWLETKIREHQLGNLILLPYQPFEELPQVLATGDVLTAVLEEDAGVFSVPSKVLSYLCAKRPLLLAVPEVNLAARIVREHKAGLTVGPAQPQEFLAAAQRLREESHLAPFLAFNGRAYAEATFGIADIAAQFEEILSGKPLHKPDPHTTEIPSVHLAKPPHPLKA